MKQKFSFMIAGVIVVLGILLPKASAVTVSVSDLPSSVDQQQEISVPIQLDCLNCSSSSFLRGVFYTAGSSSYFGLTQALDGSWINAPGGSCTKYYEVPSSTIFEGTWSGVLKIKPDIDSAYYNGPGEYQFKIGRYTGSCSSPTWSTEKTIAITGPTHTPTPTQTNTPLPTAAQTATPTNKPSATYTPTVSPTATIIHSPSPIRTFSPTPDTIASIASVLGTSQDTSIDVQSYSASNSSYTHPRTIIISLLLIASGFGLLSGVFAWKKYIEISCKDEN